MEQSKGADYVDRMMESYQSAKTGSIGVAQEWQKFIDKVAAVEAEDLPEGVTQDDVIGVLNSKTLSIQKARAGVATGKTIRDAIVAKFPEAIPVPPEGP